MKVLVTGAQGQLGRDVCLTLAQRGIEVIAAGHRDLDITDEVACRSFLVNHRPQAVIHCAAYTKVDLAEDMPEAVLRVNTTGAENLALACRDVGAKLLYLSTDYVFPGEGDAFYEIDSPTGPLGIYGATKLAGERAVQRVLTQYFIVRISWVFGIYGNNFVKTMLHLAKTRDVVGVVCDQIGSPTYASDLALLLCNIIETEKYGVYHATNEGVCTWADFAEEIFRIANTGTQVNRILTKDYPTKAKRPLNSRLSKCSLDAGGFARLPDWRDALRRYFA